MDISFKWIRKYDMLPLKYLLSEFNGYHYLDINLKYLKSKQTEY